MHARLEIVLQLSHMSAIEEAEVRLETDEHVHHTSADVMIHYNSAEHIRFLIQELTVAIIKDAYSRSC